FGGIVVSRTASFDFASIPPGKARIPQQRRRRPYATQNRRYRGGIVGSWSYRVPGGAATSILSRAWSIVRLTLLPLGIAGYIGIAILGWGCFTAFFSHPPLIALSILVLTMSGVAFFAGGNLSPGVREDRGNRWVLPVFAIVGLLGAYLPAYTD